MIRYTVVWDQDAEDQFIECWIASDSQVRENLTRISNWIDAELGFDAATKGKAFRGR